MWVYLHSDALRVLVNLFHSICGCVLSMSVLITFLGPELLLLDKFFGTILTLKQKLSDISYQLHGLYLNC